MTISVGYYCQYYRRRYVRHKCKDGLPCGHPIDESVFIWLQRFSGGAEGKPTISVVMSHKGFEFEMKTERQKIDDYLQELCGWPDGVRKGFKPENKTITEAFLEAFRHG